MEHSAALANELERLYEAFAAGDGDTMEDLTTARDGLVFIGTDPDEWFDKTTDIRRMLESQAGSGVKVRHGDIQAYEEGTVGWVADAGNFVMADGTEVPFRMTAVFHREDGAWKLVQEHASIATTNEEALGVEI